MISPYNFHVCKRSILFAPAVKKAPVLLPRNINTSISKPLDEVLFPSTMAVAGSLAILFGLRTFKERFYSKGSFAVHQQRASEAKQKQELKSDISFDSNVPSATTNASLCEERDPSVLQMLTPKVSNFPGLSSILQSHAFGSSNLRCITKLEGIDVAPKNTRSRRRANEHVSTHEMKSRKNKRKQKKNVSPQISASSNNKDGQTSEIPVRKTVAERESSRGNSDDVLRTITAGTEEPINQKEAAGNVGSANQSSRDFQGHALDSNAKKNRKPRPRHISKAQNSTQYTVQQSENGAANCGDDRTSGDFAASKSDTAQEGVTSLSGPNECGRNSWKREHRSRKKSSTSESKRIHPAPAEHQPHDPESLRYGKEVNARYSPGMQASAEESAMSRPHKAFQNAPSSEEDKHGRASCNFTSQDVRSCNEVGLQLQRQRLKKASWGDKPIHSDQIHPPENPSRRMRRKYHSRRRYFDLDEPQGRST